MDAIQQNSLFTETRCEPLISASTLALKMYWPEHLMLMIFPPCSPVRGPWKKGNLWETHSQLCRLGEEAQIKSLSSLSYHCPLQCPVLPVAGPPSCLVPSRFSAGPGAPPSWALLTFRGLAMLFPITLSALPHNTFIQLLPCTCLRTSLPQQQEFFQAPPLLWGAPGIFTGKTLKVIKRC